MPAEDGRAGSGLNIMGMMMCKSEVSSQNGSQSTGEVGGGPEGVSKQEYEAENTKRTDNK